MDSILATLRSLLEVDVADSSYDSVLVPYVNSAIASLTQMGVGPSTGYSIVGATERWNDFVQDATLLSLVKSYIHLKIKLIFDPPTNSTVIEAINHQISELEFRIPIQLDLMRQTITEE